MTRWGVSLVLFILLVAGAWWLRPVSDLPKAVDHRTNFATVWQDESQYIVEWVATDLFEMAYFAGHGQAFKEDPEFLVVALQTQDRNKVEYELQAIWSGGRLEHKLSVTDSIWSPTTYQPWAEKVLRQLAPEVKASGDSASSILEKLTTPTPETLVKLDLECSALLKKAFNSPAAHEQAALLLDSMALRESSGRFFQIRAELCRSCAHLAFAQALRQNSSGPGPEGKLAEAGLAALYGHQVKALELLKKCPDGAWKNALKLRITGDYRAGGSKKASPTLLEERERFRALAFSLGAESTWERLGRMPSDWSTLADWTRLVNRGGPGVELGHILLQERLKREQQEWALVCKLAGYSSELNVAPQRCITSSGIAVAGAGLWAGAAQRHLCNALVSGQEFLRDQYGDPEAAAEWRAQADKTYGQLLLYPFVSRQLVDNEEDYRRAQDASAALIHKFPERSPPECWNQICYNVPYCKQYTPPPHAFVNEWHKLNPPPGTVYDLYPRLDQPSLVSRNDSQQRLADLHRMAPYNPWACQAVLEKVYRNEATPEVVEKVYGPLLDYVPSGCTMVAQTPGQSAAGQEKWLRRAVALQPGYNLELARFYQGRGLERQAVKAYLSWTKAERDEVRLSNGVDWLVQHLEKSGEGGQATALADRAAATGSFRGLLTKARLLERRRQNSAALPLYLESWERYRKPGALLGFLVRSGQDPALREKLLNQYVPEGLKRYASTKAPPQQGAFAQSDHEGGIRRGDVVVALQGYQVWDASTLDILGDMHFGRPYSIVVWRGEGYLNLPIPEENRFEDRFEDYP